VTADQTVESVADKVQDLADRMAAEGGIKSQLAEQLADDANLIRKMKPSLIKARAKGEAPTNSKPGEGRVAPSNPPLPATPKAKRKGGPTPWLVVGVALAAGICVAKWIDWRGHGDSRG
jgi:hypothetical protein